MYVCIHICIYVCVCMYIYMCLCMLACMYVNNLNIIMHVYSYMYIYNDRTFYLIKDIFFSQYITFW